MKGPVRTPSNAAVVESVKLRTNSGQFRCPLCPDREFQKISRVGHHIGSYHTMDRKCCPAGRKQLRVIKVTRAEISKNTCDAA